MGKKEPGNRGRRTEQTDPGTTNATRILSACLFAFFLAVAPASAQQSLFWLQTDGAVSHLGSVGNPTANVQLGRTTPLHIWFTKDSAPLGFDGVSFDVRLTSTNGGSAQAAITIDTPAGRWTQATPGVSRSDTGGQGVDDCNAFDLTNTDTLPSGASRFATVNLTGVTQGTVQLFLCVGQFGIADSGQNAVVWIGFKQGQTAAENLNISGGIAGQCSLVADATINVTPKMGDFDGDGDVDISDFGPFQACMSGTDVDQNDAACDAAKLDGDSDVDQSDFAIFEKCISGEGILAAPNCTSQ